MSAHVATQRLNARAVLTSYIWMDHTSAAPHCLSIKLRLYRLVVNFIRMSIVIIAYLVLIILWAVKSIRHNPIPFCRSKVHPAWWCTAHCRPLSSALLPFLRAVAVIEFSEHFNNKSRTPNNAVASPLSQRESTGRAILITRLIMLATVVSRSYSEWQRSIQMSRREQSDAKIFSAERAG